MKAKTFPFLPFDRLKPIVSMLAFCILFSHSLLFCQVPFCTKRNLPKLAENVGPFVDTVNQKVWSYPSPGAKKWYATDLANYQSFEACGRYLILTKLNGGIDVLYTDIYCHIFSADSVFCSDSVVTFFSNHQIVMLSIKRNVALGIREGYGGRKNALQYLGGQEGYCVHSFYEAISRGSYTDIHSWGVLDRNTGHWLIQPIYDEPFHFKNGIAEVIYYGQRRKINEKGAFVE